MDDVVSVRREGDVALLTLQRGQRDNALDGAALEALKRASLKLSDAPPRALVLTGVPTFSAGLDLSPDNAIVQRLEALSRQRDVYLITEYVAGLRNVIASFSRIPCPVIAAIEGPCLGLGLELALACDIRIAARDAQLGMPEVAVGLAPLAGGLVQLRRVVGPARAAELVLTARRLDAETAASWGLVSQVVDAGQALGAAFEVAHQILRNSRPAVVQAMLALRQLGGSNEDFVLADTAASRAVAAGDLTEGALASLQQRAPRWKA